MSTESKQNSQNQFTGVRAIFWPIQQFELKKFLPMGFMMFCTLFNYTILRDTKDALVVTAPASGAEVLPFVKTLTILVALLFMIFYTKMANALSRENLFYAALIPFLVFFAAFAAIIFPNIDTLHMSLETMQALQTEYDYLRFPIAMLGNWSFSIFYVMSELWGSVVISLLFWQFANEITRVAEAKRFYALFGMIANFALILSGATIVYFSSFEGTEAGANMIRYLMAFIVLSGSIIVGIYYWMNRVVLTDPRHYEADTSAKKKDKPKLSVAESFKYILTSPYIGLIVGLLIAYGVAINLVEGVWKSMLKLRFPEKTDYNNFMGKFSMTTGIFTIMLMIIGSNILRRFSWLKAAIITPIMILVTGLIFFGVVIYLQGDFPDIKEIVILAPSLLMMAIWVGMGQNVLTKATKYSLFDPTKEMAYIPLDQELKVKGKAAADVIGGRLGKFGGAAIQMILLSVIAGSTLPSLSPILAVIVIGIVIVWIMCVFALSKRFEATRTKREAESKKTAAASA